MADEFSLEDTPQANLGEIGDTLVAEIPEPQEHAINEAMREAGADSGAPAGEVDALGIPWDASLHATGADGKGVKTAKGAWRKRRGLKGSASILRSGSNATPGADTDAAQPTQGPSASELQARMAGKMAGTLFVRSAMLIGGEDFTPREFDVPGAGKVSEEHMMQDAFGTYFAAKDIRDVPPGAVLAFTILAYVAPRFTMPRTKEKARGFVQWVKEKIVLWRLRRADRKANKPNRSERRAGVTPAEREGATVIE